MKSIEPPNRVLVPLVLLVAGVSGFCLGWWQPEWQIAVEGAQVVAGVVPYPVPTPLSMYYRSLSTVLHPLCAAGLRAGLSEQLLSCLLSGFIGMLWCQALALCVLALCQDAWLAVATPFFLLHASPAVAGMNYAIMTPGSEHSYGAVAILFPLLAIGVFAAGWVKTGGLLLGLAPAVHPGTGIIVSVAALVCIAGTVTPPRDREGLPWMLLGCAISGAGLLVHLRVPHAGLGVLTGAYADYLEAFLRYWDGHRRPIALWSPPPLFVAGCVALCALGLTAWRGLVFKESRFFLRILIVSALIVGALSAFQAFGPARAPNVLVALMPLRVFNLHVLGFSVLVIGLLAQHQRSAACAWILAVLLIVLAAWPEAANYVLLLSGAALALSLTALRRVPPMEPPTSISAASAGWVARLVCVLVIAWVGAAAYEHRHESRARMMDWTNDAFWRTASEGRGLVLTSSDLHFVQLRARRPVLFDGWMLDILPYVPEAGLAMRRILQDIDGVDFFHPSPDNLLHRGSVARDTGKIVWEQRTPEQWSEIGKAFQVTQVMTYADWTLQLPVLARNDQFILYRVVGSVQATSS